MTSPVLSLRSRAAPLSSLVTVTLGTAAAPAGRRTASRRARGPVGAALGGPGTRADEGAVSLARSPFCLHVGRGLVPRDRRDYVALSHLLDVAAAGLVRFCDLATFWYRDDPHVSGEETAVERRVCREEGTPPLSVSHAGSCHVSGISF